MAPSPFVVAAREQDTADTWTLTLEPAACELSPVGPGQFMMVYAFGIGEVPISVSGPPNEPGPVVLTIRAVGAVTRALCASRPGTRLGLRGPFGNTWPIAEVEGHDVLVVAGGIGLAPLRPVVLHALAHEADYGRIAVLYGARTPRDLLYPAQCAGWRRRADVAITVDAADSTWRGRVGVVPKLIADAPFDPACAAAFVCGPEIMMRFAIEALRARGVRDESIHVSMERDMRCGVGLCGHCQLGPTLICRDGPVYSVAEIGRYLEVEEL
jgi:anaerobic sulfite reductase subunit B